MHVMMCWRQLCANTTASAWDLATRQPVELEGKDVTLRCGQYRHNIRKIVVGRKNSVGRMHGDMSLGHEVQTVERKVPAKIQGLGQRCGMQAPLKCLRSPRHC